MGAEAHVILPLNCLACAGPIDVGCDEGAPQTIRFNCPYCQTPREYEAPGPVLWVAMRQHALGPDTKH